MSHSAPCVEVDLAALAILPCFGSDCTGQSDIDMEGVLHDGNVDHELKHWLKCESRCFGDKGDVEDITEGQF